MNKETKFTPAPLEVAILPMSEAIRLIKNRMEVRAILDSHRNIVAVVFGDDVLSIPDANLFAASPDVFEALQLMVSPIDHFSGCLFLNDKRMPCQCNLNGRINQALEQANAAINKALGNANREVGSEN